MHLDTVDVVVTDGFTGNVALKSMEAALRSLAKLVFSVLDATPEAREAAKVVLPGLLDAAAAYDPDVTGGAALLGVKGITVISHGSSSARAIRNAIDVAADCARVAACSSTCGRPSPMPAETHVDQGPLGPDEVLALIRERLAEILEIDESRITREASFADDLEADSLALIELVEALEAELGERTVGFTVDDEDLAELKTVGEATDYVVARLGVPS